MFQHNCEFDDFKIIGQRMNPLDALWSEWTLIVCTKCRKLAEWQHHSEEQMHGGDLHIAAEVTNDHLWNFYQLKPDDIQTILNGEKKVKRYDRYEKCVVESYV
jgi:hypothetical protein